MEVYQGSNGRYYTDLEVWERLEAEEWTPLAWDSASGDEWMSTPAGDVLHLKPIAPPDLPPTVTLEAVEDGYLARADPPPDR